MYNEIAPRSFGYSLKANIIMIYKIGDAKVGINQILRMQISKLKNTNTIQFNIETALQE